MMLLRLALRNCIRQKMRSTFIVLTIACGALGVMIFDGMNGGILAAYRQSTIHAKYAHGQIFARGYWGELFEMPADHWMPNPKPLLDYLQTSPLVQDFFPRISFPGIISHGGRQAQGLGFGVEGKRERDFFRELKFVQGTHLTGDPGDVILGLGLAKILGVQVGDDLDVQATTVNGTMNLLTLRVVGIFEIGARDLDQRFFQLEFRTTQTLLDTEKIEGVAVALKEDGAWPKLKEDLEARFGQTEAIPFEELDWVFYGNSVKWLDSQMGIFYAVLVFVMFLAIAQSIAQMVLSRREEFGFLRANGERPIRIFGILVLETLLIAGSGASLGVGSYFLLKGTILASGLSLPPPPGFTRAITFYLQESAGHLTLVSSVILVIALLATMLASWRVLRLDIARSIRLGSVE